MTAPRWVALFLSLGPALVQAGSRIGNAQLGYESEIPEPFGYSHQTIQGNVVFVAPGAYFDANKPMPVFPSLKVMDWHATYPEWSELNRGALVEKLATPTWEKLQTLNPCVEAALATDGFLYTVIAAWGPAKGVVLVGEKLDVVKNGIVGFLQKLQLAPGACTWTP